MPTPVTDPSTLRLLAGYDRLDAMREDERNIRQQLDGVTNLINENRAKRAPKEQLKPVTDPAVLSQLESQLEPERRGFASGLARSLEQGATLGFGDELNAAVRAGYGSLARGQPFGAGYDRALADERAANAEFAEQNPAIDFGAQFAGGMLPGLLAPGLAGVNYVRRATTAAQAARRAGAVGAGYGAVAGFGAGQDGLLDRAASGAVGAPLGFGLGAAFGYGGHRLGEAIGGFRQAQTEVDPQSGAFNVIAKSLGRDRIQPGQLRGEILPPAGRTVTQDMIADMARLSNEGLTQDQIAQRLGVHPTTVGNHLRNFAARNESPLTITDRAALQGPGSGTNTQWTMRAAAATPGEARTRAAETFTERQLGQAQRVTDAVQRSFGDGDLEGRIAQLQAGVRQQEQAAYRAAYASEQPFDLAPVLERWQSRVNPGFQRGQVQGRVAEGNTPLSRGLNQAIGAFFDEVDVPSASGGNPVKGFFPIRGLERFQRAKEELDHAIELSFKDHRPTVLTRQLQQFKTEVMGEVRRTNPEWARANDLFFDGRAGDRALALGEGVALRMGQASRTALRQFEAMDEAQQELFRQGFSRRLQDMLLNKTHGSDVTAALRTPAARTMIRRIIERRGTQVRNADSRREADRFLRIIDEEAAGTRTFRSLQGSQTTPLREAVEDLNAPAYLTSAASFFNPKALASEALSQAARRVYERRNNAVLELLSETDPVRQINILDQIGRYSAARGAGGATALRGTPAANALGAETVRGLVGQTPQPAFDERNYDPQGNRRLPPPPGMMRLGGPALPGTQPPAQLPAPFGVPQLSPGMAGLSMLPGLVSRDLTRAGNALDAVTAPARRLFLEGGWQQGPQSPQAASDMQNLLLATGLGATALPRPAGSVGAFGFGRGMGKQVSDEIAALEAELTQLAAQSPNAKLARSLTRIMERPQPVPGTSREELRRYDIAYRDLLRKKIADERQAIQDARYSMPRTSVPAPISSTGLSAALSAREKIAANPFTQAIPGRRGFPTKAEQRALGERAVLDQFGGPPPTQGPWTPLKPVDPREMTEAEKLLLSETLKRLNPPRKPPPKS